MLAMPRRLPPAVNPDPRDVALRPADVAKDAPLRLSVAAEIAFPFGGMTAAGLRKEAARGKLSIERIAGKDYTTLAAIEEMRGKCRKEAKAPDCGSGRPEPRMVATSEQHGSSATESINRARDALSVTMQRLKGSSPLEARGTDGARPRLSPRRQREL
jgi:hypothetical protein